MARCAPTQLEIFEANKIKFELLRLEREKAAERTQQGLRLLSFQNQPESASPEPNYDLSGMDDELPDWLTEADFLERDDEEVPAWLVADV